jgi:hypothetical protein
MSSPGAACAEFVGERTPHRCPRTLLSGRQPRPARIASQPGRATLNYPLQGPPKPVATDHASELTKRDQQCPARLTFAGMGVMSSPGSSSWPSVSRCAELEASDGGTCAADS